MGFFKWVEIGKDTYYMDCDQFGLIRTSALYGAGFATSLVKLTYGENREFKKDQI